MTAYDSYDVGFVNYWLSVNHFLELYGANHILLVSVMVVVRPAQFDKQVFHIGVLRINKVTMELEAAMYLDGT